MAARKTPRTTTKRRPPRRLAEPAKGRLAMVRKAAKKPKRRRK
jgi:hypothetical protein